MLETIINKLFDCTYYGSWILSVLGVFISIVLIAFNINLGIQSILTFVCTLLLAQGLTMILVPEQILVFENIKSKNVIGCINILIAGIVFGVIYFMNGGFPPVNLIFI